MNHEDMELLRELIEKVDAIGHNLEKTRKTMNQKLNGLKNRFDGFAEQSCETHAKVITYDKRLENLEMFVNVHMKERIEKLKEKTKNG
jgi:hypothetical protein